jgi:phosphoribosyl-ATP pyrophosphohydrolase
LQELEAVLAQRKRDMPNRSYSAKLLANRTKLVRKVMEEAFEVATAQGKEELVWEIADLLYHSLLLAVAQGVTWQDVVNELAGRHRQPRGKS